MSKLKQANYSNCLGTIAIVSCGGFIWVPYNSSSQNVGENLGVRI